MDYARRRDRVRARLKRQGLAGLLITNFVNVTYLTGFTGDDSYLLLTQTGDILLSDARYDQQLQEECPGLELAIRRPPVLMPELVAKTIAAARVQQVGVEADSMTLALRDQLASAAPKVEWMSTRGWVSQLREIKDKPEIECIRRSIDVAQRAFQVLRAALRPEQAERQVAFDLEHQIRLFGGSGCSFPPIIAAGPRAALPHARPGPALVGDSDFVLVDWGAKVDGYASDLTRVLVAAKISPKLERIYGVVLKAQLQAIAAIRPGVLMSEVDRAARQVIEEAGFGRRFGHGLGHGFGLEIHEQPRLAPNQDRPLAAGMVVTVEPGIYVPGWGGVRIEDDILVTRNGHEVLSDVPKDLSEGQVLWP